MGGSADGIFRRKADEKIGFALGTPAAEKITRDSELSGKEAGIVIKTASEPTKLL